jgi:mannose-6-phosphate isomerase-like protein (cupin superfamily)
VDSLVINAIQNGDSNTVASTNPNNASANHVSEKIDVLQLASRIDAEWRNFVASRVDDHVARVVVQENTSHWHLHPEGDELFLVIVGQYAIELEDRTVELDPVKCSPYRR